MSTSTITPEVQQFLTAVRAQLADLDPEEQRDITEGLEADLVDLVAERGGEALGDPVAYARELRTAAGLEPEMRAARSRRPVGEQVHAFLDAAHDRWDRLVDGLPGRPWELLVALRPAWWVLRAWVALQAVDLVWGRGGYGQGLSLVPSLRGLGLPLLLVAVLVSVLVGLGRLWPTKDGALGRVCLLAVNLVAIGFLAPTLESVDNNDGWEESIAFDRGYQAGMRDMREDAGNSAKAGLYSDGTWVSQIYPYDAQGRPLAGVQLFDQVGAPIDVVPQPEYPTTEIDDFGNEVDANGNPIDPSVPLRPRVYYPWSNGAAQLFNVFPIASRVQDGEEPSPTAFTDTVRPTIGPFPLTSVPSVSLPGIVPGVQKAAVQK